MKDNIPWKLRHFLIFEKYNIFKEKTRMSKFENDLLHFICQHSFTMTISSAENNIRAVVNNMQCMQRPRGLKKNVKTLNVSFRAKVVPIKHQRGNLKQKCIKFHQLPVVPLERHWHCIYIRLCNSLLQSNNIYSIHLSRISYLCITWNTIQNISFTFVLRRLWV